MIRCFIILNNLQLSRLHSAFPNKIPCITRQIDRSDGKIDALDSVINLCEYGRTLLISTGKGTTEISVEKENARSTIVRLQIELQTR